MNQTDIYLVRHGQTEWNAQRRIQGTTEVSLNDCGREQARKLGKEFAELCIGAIYTSPLGRAKETAEIIASFHGCGIFIDPMLHEGKFGALEGITVDEFHKKFAEAIKARHMLPREERMRHKYVPEAESIQEITARVVPSLHRIAQAHSGENVIVVTHGFVMRSLLSVIGGFEEREIMVGNGGMLHLKGDGLELQVVKHAGIEFHRHEEIVFKKERIV
jgi:broad specificity phosphatase PhoE